MPYLEPFNSNISQTFDEVDRFCMRFFISNLCLWLKTIRSVLSMRPGKIEFSSRLFVDIKLIILWKSLKHSQRSYTSGSFPEPVCLFLCNKTKTCWVFDIAAKHIDWTYHQCALQLLPTLLKILAPFFAFLKGVATRWKTKIALHLPRNSICTQRDSVYSETFSSRWIRTVVQKIHIAVPNWTSLSESPTLQFFPQRILLTFVA